jgi:hypothetical protein
MFDKALRPIKLAVKRQVAKSVDTAGRLRAGGCPTPAIRFPASPGEIKAAKAAMGVIRRASGVVSRMGGSVSTARLEAAMGVVTNAEEGQPKTAAVKDLGELMALMQADIAYCAGIVRAETEGLPPDQNTLLRAHSIKRTLAEFTFDASEGRSLQKVCAKRIEAAITEGTIMGRHIGAAPVAAGVVAEVDAANPVAAGANA